MSESSGKWSLMILAAHSQRWSQQVAQEFRDGVSSLLADVESRMRTDHPSLHLQPLYHAVGRRGTLQTELGASFAFAILDVTDFDEDLAFLAGLVQGTRTPYVFLCRGESETVIQRWGLNEARVIPYESAADLFRPNSRLHREVSQAISPARVLEELVYEIWFPRETATIWVVCPQIHNPGEFADRSSPDYTYLDNLGDTDALLETMVFLSQHYPKASIEKTSSRDLQRDHTKNNLVVIGGPGSSDNISNHVCQEMMSSMNSRVSYTADCETMRVALGGDEPLELRAALRSDTPDPTRPDTFNMRRDYGYFARFPNPLNEDATVILANGIHTAGVLGAARAFADRREALRNYHSVFNSGASPRSFECHFEVGVLNGDVQVPNIVPDSIYSLGSTKRLLANILGDVGEGQRDVEKRGLITVLFVAGDRGGLQRNQIQTPKEFKSIQDALQRCEQRDAFSLAPPIMAATPQDFVEAYCHRPAILHLVGHGDDRSLSFIQDQRVLASQTPLIADQIATILGNFPERVCLCVLNTCESASVAKHLVDAHAVDAAVGWPVKLADASAIAFSETLYGCLGNGLSLFQSVTLASESCGSEEKPVLHTNANVDPNVFTFVPRNKK